MNAELAFARHADVLDQWQLMVTVLDDPAAARRLLTAELRTLKAKRRRHEHLDEEPPGWPVLTRGRPPKVLP